MFIIIICFQDFRLNFQKNNILIFFIKIIKKIKFSNNIKKQKYFYNLF